jgi:hypothetical protein
MAAAALMPATWHAYRVSPAALDLMWSVVAPLLAKAVKREHGRFTLEDVYRWVRNNHQQLWVATSNGQCYAAGLIKMERYPTGKRTATLHLAGGSRMTEWVAPAMEAWLRACRLLGATEMRVVGRRGWTRVLRRYGFVPEAVVLTRTEH